MGVYKFYFEYVGMMFDCLCWLECYEDCFSIIVFVCLECVDEVLEFVYYFVNQIFMFVMFILMNLGKVNMGWLVSCFLFQDCIDNLDFIIKMLFFVVELSKGGGGIGVEVSNLWVWGESLCGIQNVMKGVLGVVKMLDNMLCYVD